jgi:hypothetical protein
MRPVEVTLLLWMFAPLVAAQDKPPAVNADAAILQDFTKRVGEYVKLHKSVEDSLPRLKKTESPEKIERHEHELARRIREARGPAGEGAIFTPEIGAEFKRLIALAMQGQKATVVKQSLKHAEPVRAPKRLRVNHSYPEHLPLQSTPPTLLENLPRLPPELEYRIVGHDLILRDAKANLVVDLVPNAIP